MAHPLRIAFPGAIYHVTARGKAREAIFRADADRELFLDALGEVVTRFGWLCHAYCLMDNHYHLLIETPQGNLSPGMRQLNGVYTQRFNRHHARVGHVYESRRALKQFPDTFPRFGRPEAISEYASGWQCDFS